VDIGQLHVALKSVCRNDHAIDGASLTTTMRMRVIRVDEECSMQMNHPPLSIIGAAFIHLKQENT
jgi:hypothetical protein